MPEIEQVLPDWQRVMATEGAGSRQVSAAAPGEPNERAPQRGH
jgi:hypothetical protein